MPHDAGRCPLTDREIVDEYFIENRTRLLDIAAFLDRLDRASEAGAEDFRVTAFRRALQATTDPGTGRVERIQMLLSDRGGELLAALDRKSAWGAPAPRIPA